MSWQSYVDSNLVGTGSVTKGAIIGLEDKQVWASSSDLSFAPGELDAIFAAFERPGTPPENGVKINGIKYIYIRPSDDGAGIQLKHSLNGACLFKTKRAVILGVYESPIQQPQCYAVVSGLGQYLITQNY